MVTSSRNILIVGPAWVGDMVMAHSLFKLIKQRDPGAVIDVLAPSWTFSLLSRMPEVSQALEMPIAHGKLNIKARFAIGKQCRAARYDQAIILPNSFKSALVPWFAKIPIRTGWQGEGRYGIVNDRRRLDKKKYPLMIEQFMALGLSPNEALPAPYPFPAFSSSPTTASATLAKHGLVLSGRPILALAPGAEYGPAKRWPIEYFAAVANQKRAEGWEVWLLGSQKDKSVTDSIMQLTTEGCENLAGRTQLAETIDLLALASGMVTNDSGLMHIAAALGKPVIALYGPTSPHFTPPLSQQATVLQLALDCQPCFARACPLGHQQCMRELRPATVLAAMAAWKV